MELLQICPKLLTKDISGELFLADFSNLELLWAMPATQAHAAQLSLGRQKFCLEVGTELEEESFIISFGFYKVCVYLRFLHISFST